MHLVTGATGLVGTHLLAHLLKLDSQPIRAMYRNEGKRKFAEEVIRYCYPEVAQKLVEVEWINCDLLDIDGLTEALKGVEEVYHAAALVSFSNRDWKKLYRTNVEGTHNIVNVALDEGVSLFVHVSSTSALPRKDDHTQISEDVSWTREIGKNGYGRSKFMAEREVWRGAEEGLNVIVVNPSVLLGPGNWNESSLEIFKRVYNGLKFYPLGGDAFTDVRDVARAILFLRERNLTGQRYMLAANNAKIQELLNEIADSFSKRKPSIRVSMSLAFAAARVEAVLSFFSGRSPKLNRHTARVSSTVRTYDSSKIKSLGFEFTEFSESVNFASEWFKYAVANSIVMKK